MACDDRRRVGTKAKDKNAEELSAARNLPLMNGWQQKHTAGTVRRHHEKITNPKIAIQFCDWVSYSCGPVVSRRAGAFS
jgi:hypothetical protein